jgi:endonuclease YncB( thermonuclease family)
MQPRETFTNLLITFALVLLIVAGALLLRDRRDVPAAIPVAASTPQTEVRQERAVAIAEPVAESKMAHNMTDQFRTYEQPALINSSADEADTLQFRVDGSVQRFVLYYVDALESSPTHPERLAKQASYFGHATPEIVLQTGREAHAYVQDLLKAKPFRLLTCWEQQKNTERYYALILVELEKGRWTYLSDLLVRQGLAWIDGWGAPFDDTRTVVAHLSELRVHARFARENRLGIWAKIKP